MYKSLGGHSICDLSLQFDDAHALLPMSAILLIPVLLLTFPAAVAVRFALLAELAITGIQSGTALGTSLTKRSQIFARIFQNLLLPVVSSIAVSTGERESKSCFGPKIQNTTTIQGKNKWSVT